METRYEYLSNPATLISLAVFLFSLGMAYAYLKAEIKRLSEEIKDNKEDCDKRISKVEADVKAIDGEGMKITLSQIQIDLQRIKNTLASKK